MKIHKYLAIVMIIAMAAVSVPDSTYALRPSAYKLRIDAEEMSNSLESHESRRTGHNYIEVTEAEEEAIIGQIVAETSRGAAKYIKRFSHGVKAKQRLLKIPLKDTKCLYTIGFSENPVTESLRIAPHGILCDEDGILWVVRKYRGTWFGGKCYSDNIKELEMLTSLFFEKRANTAEIRFISKSEATGLSIFKHVENIDDYYLRRVVTSENMSKDMLVQQDAQRAFSALIVGNIFLRKGDPHFSNFCFARKVPVSIDNNYALVFNEAADRENNFKRFMTSYLYHVLFEPAEWLLAKPKDTYRERYGYRKYLKIYNGFLNLLRRGIKDPANALNMSLTARRNFGLGGGFAAAEMLDIVHIRESILDFKSIKNVREFVEKAGYSGEDLEVIVRFIEANQRTLGRDVNEVLKAATGKDYGLGKIDEIEKAKEPVLYTKELLDSYKKDIERLKEIQKYGWNYLSKEAIYVLLNPDKAEWMVNFFPMTYYEIRTFMMRKDAVEFCDKYNELCEEFKAKTVSLIKDELTRLHASGIPGVREVIEGLNIDEFVSIVNGVPKGTQADIRAEKMSVLDNSVMIAISAAA
ncbi:MAG: hypothetical protein ABH843_03930 [Candidatus Omnitrophota bacterium]